MGDARERDPIGAYEWVSAAYGFGPCDIDRRFTQEQLVAYLDAAQERVAAEGRRAIEAVRVGTIFAHDQRAYERWTHRQSGGAAPSRGLTGAALEAAIVGFAYQHPEYVVMDSR